MSKSISFVNLTKKSRLGPIWNERFLVEEREREKCMREGREVRELLKEWRFEEGKNRRGGGFSQTQFLQEKQKPTANSHDNRVNSLVPVLCLCLCLYLTCLSICRLSMPLYCAATMLARGLECRRLKGEKYRHEYDAAPRFIIEQRGIDFKVDISGIRKKYKILNNLQTIGWYLIGCDGNLFYSLVYINNMSTTLYIPISN